MRVTAFAPGRVNLIGEHTDYNGGLCLPFAFGRGVTVVAEPLAGDEVEVHAVDLGEHDRFPLGAPAAAAGWRAYVRGVAAELHAAGHRLAGARIHITSTLPAGGGLASSAALTIGCALALLDVAGASAPPAAALAAVCARVEELWAGAETGLLDQLAILSAEPGHAVLLDMRLDPASSALRQVPLSLAGWRLFLLDSGVRHDHTAGGYNVRRAECRKACELLGVESLSAAAPADVAGLPPPLDRRARHVLSENARVARMVEALERPDMEEVARLLAEGHASMRDDYEVSAPAVEDTVALLQTSGARGARMIGGGFGGHVLGLFPPGAEPPRQAIPIDANGRVRPRNYRAPRAATLRADVPGAPSPGE
jgi:galactokinase